MPRLRLNNFLRALGRRLGFDVVRHDDDLVLQSVLETYAQLRLRPRDLLHWDHVLPHVASLGYLRSQLRRHAITLVIDVGANRGQFALDVRRTGFGGDILSFEPLAAHQAELERQARADGRWKIVRCGLGAEAAELDLHVYHDDTFSSLHRINAAAKDSFGKLVALDHVERIAVRTLDEVCAELKIPPGQKILLKTDTQGHDMAVLQGARRLLHQTQVVLTEATVAPIYDGVTRIEELSALLHPLGFVPGGQFPISYNPKTHALIELDCFFHRPTTGDEASP